MKQCILLFIIIFIILFPGYSQQGMTITPGGNVGVNTSTPSEKLDVEGNVNVSGEVTVDEDIITQGRVKDKTGDVIPVGTIMPFIGVNPPEGWLLCNGSAIKSSDFLELFAVINENFGDGSVDENGNSTTDDEDFNVPDFRGMFLRGVDNGAGRDPDTTARTSLNNTGAIGDNVGSYQEYETASHHHSINHDHAPITSSLAGRHSHDIQAIIMRRIFAGISSGFSWVTNGSHLYSYVRDFNVTAIEDHTHTVDLPNIEEDTGPYGNAETRPVNIYVNYIIKY